MLSQQAASDRLPHLISVSRRRNHFKHLQPEGRLSKKRPICLCNGSGLTNGEKETAAKHIFLYIQYTPTVYTVCVYLTFCSHPICLRFMFDFRSTKSGNQALWGKKKKLPNYNACMKSTFGS